MPERREADETRLEGTVRQRDRGQTYGGDTEGNGG